jgi:16S rRNA (cytosine1402-N4)-methyltransferase
MSYHQPVLAQAVVQALVTDPNGLYVDATFGGGGHSQGLLDSLGREARLIAIDQDPEAPFEALSDPRFIPLRANFRELSGLLQKQGITHITGLLADLGVSSHQLDTAERGFSYRREGLLDLRMNPTAGFPAHAWLRQQSHETLTELLRRYGDLPRAKALADLLLCELPQTTSALRHLVEKFYGFRAKAYLPQVFQALRIGVNDELGALQDLLEAATCHVRPGGRLVVLTYHSGEARLIKALYQTPAHVDVLHGKKLYDWHLIQKIRPSQTEILQNPRSRSATLWILECQSI